MRHALVLLALSACEDALDQRLAIVDEPRVLAVISEPAEAKPGATVTYSAVLASPDGPLSVAPHWAFCTSPKPPTEDNAVSVPCTAGEELVDLGTAPTASGMLPSDGCVRFGPDTPPGGFRPRDPDPSGGYYQPVRVDVDDLLAIGLTRITCNLPTAPGDVATDYRLRYVANKNPVLDPISISDVAANRDVSLTATWPADSVEVYLYYDALSQTLVTRAESMRVSWFATGGRIDVDATASDATARTASDATASDATARTASDATASDATASDVLSASTTWHTPGAGTYWLWFVLRDSRSGIAVQSAQVTVR
jgi:hypothetical protein